jgi:lipoprotein NlpI
VKVHGRAWLLALALAGGCKKGDEAKAAFQSGYAHQVKGEYDAALRDYDRALAVKPDYASALNSRGFTYQMKGDYVRAVADYDRALAIKPDLAIALKNRGRAYFYLGKLPESEKDLAAGLRYDSTNAFVAIWLHMVRQRQGVADSSQFASEVARTDSTKWPAPVAKLYLGKSSITDLDAAAERGNANDQMLHRCLAAFYGGEMQLWSKQPAEARARLERARATCPHDQSEYQGAVAELGRLGGA